MTNKNGENSSCLMKIMNPSLNYVYLYAIIKSRTVSIIYIYIYYMIHIYIIYIHCKLRHRIEARIKNTIMLIVVIYWFY